MTATITRRTHTPALRAELSDRAARLLQMEIDFIDNPAFAEEALADRQLPMGLGTDDKRTKEVDLPSHLRKLCEVQLLTEENESELFREMNLLKYQAEALRARLDPSTVTASELSAVESRLARAQTIRDHIIQANIRLVVSIVKKFVTPQQSFDELLSEGIVALMQAVEKFDYDRGFRFSTYAYRSIARNAYRHVTAACKEESRLTRDADDWAFEQEESRSASSMTDKVWHHLRERMASMLDQLDRREQFIIRSRYALGAHRAVRPFQFLADKLGVSKERVRQIEQRAVAKMRAMAAELEKEELFGAAMA